MSVQAFEKGVSFENEVENFLLENSIPVERHKRIKGFGKTWVVDFYLPEHSVVIECKNITSKNLKSSLKLDCLKVLDVYNRTSQMSFILVFPHADYTMARFARFCTKYNIKLATLSTLLEALGQNVETVNAPYYILKKQRPVLQREEAVLSLLRKKDGLNAEQIAKRMNWKYNASNYMLRRLESKGLLLGIRKGTSHQDKRYYLKSMTLPLTIGRPIP